MKTESAIASQPVKRLAQALFKQIGLYERLKASRVYDLYWSFAGSHWLADRDREVEFYRTTLSDFRKGNMIFDIGANEGFKTDVFLRLGAKVVAVEPDETNVKILNGKFLTHRIFPKPVTVVGAAVSDHTDNVTMWIDAPGSALNTLNPKWVEALRSSETHTSQRLCFAAEKTVRATTLEKLIASHGIPFYVKIDVEGHELNVLRGLKQPVAYLSFEVNLPEFQEEGLECIDILNRLAPDGEFNHATDCRLGLASKSWLPQNEFIRAYRECREPVMEIFWRTPQRFHFNPSRT